jgi:hypothetical protein
MYEAVTMHITHKRRRVIHMAKTGEHKNNVQKCKGDREGVNQKTRVLLGHQNINTLMHTENIPQQNNQKQPQGELIQCCAHYLSLGPLFSVGRLAAPSYGNLES